MPQEYTPAGSSASFTIPVFSDVIDGQKAFRDFADDVAANAVPKQGGAFSGTVTTVSPTGAGSNGVRNITISDQDPSSGVGQNGDIWIRYV